MDRSKALSSGSVGLGFRGIKADVLQVMHTFVLDENVEIAMMWLI